jgi:hypothetical protein
MTNETGMSRFEWEKEIPVDEAKSLLFYVKRYNRQTVMKYK